MKADINTEFYDWLSPYYEQLFPLNLKEQKQRWKRIIDYLGEGNIRRILDVACGIGKKAVTLSSMGYDVTGVDISRESIDVAKNISAKNDLDVTYFVSDMRSFDALPTHEMFDLAICLGNSIAYIMNNENLKLAFKSIHDVLRNNGVFMVDSRNFDKILRNWEKERWVYQGIVEENKRRYTFINVREKGPRNDQITFNFVKIPIDGKGTEIESKQTIYRTLTLSELSTTLEEVGFKKIETFADFEFHPYDPERSDVMCLIVRK